MIAAAVFLAAVALAAMFVVFGHAGGWSWLAWVAMLSAAIGAGLALRRR